MKRFQKKMNFTEKEWFSVLINRTGAKGLDEKTMYVERATGFRQFSHDV